MNSLCCIVVPVYKDFTDLLPNEILSLSQLGKILGRHPIVLVTHNGIDTTTYVNHLVSEDSTSVKIENFDQKYFNDIDGYNSLLLSTEFYKRFSSYNYILIYQLDAWVFRDELEYWCKKGYDYIGAPWFEDWGLGKSEEFREGGNGGFSLRTPNKAIKILKRTRLLFLFIDLSIFKVLLKLRIINHFLKSIKIKEIHKVFYLKKHYPKVTEDYFWSYVVPVGFQN